VEDSEFGAFLAEFHELSWRLPRPHQGKSYPGDGKDGPTSVQAIRISDFYLIKRRCLDIPALYQPYGRYRYMYGVNWRALVAMVCPVTQQLPGLVNVLTRICLLGTPTILRT